MGGHAVTDLPSAPPPIGDPKRPLPLHNRMWALYVLEARSARDTAAALNLEFKKAGETAGSVKGYADRQAWGKATMMSLPQARPPATPAPQKTGKPPLVDRELEPAPERRAGAAVVVSPDGPAVPRVDLAGPEPLRIAPAPAVEYLDDKALPDFSQPVRPEHLHTLQCKWPIGSPGTDAFRHCGKRKLPGLPYCASHCEKAYPPGSKTRQEARDAAKNSTAH